MGLGLGDSQRQELPIADRPGGPTMAPPFSRQDERRPAQLMGGAGDSGIGAAGTAVEQQMDQPTATAGEQLSGNPLMGPDQITTTTSRDHQRASRDNLRPR